ncbi:MAG: hypothetical protein Q8K97_05175 [Pseudohongiella sp.]|nr:hypothetical protein [Pseudohongiella sp.]
MAWILRGNNTNQLTKDAIERMRSVGWIEAEERAVDFVDRMFVGPTQPNWRRDSIGDWIQELAIQPLSLKHTILSKGKIIGVMPSGELTENGFTGITRLISHLELGRVVLVERNYSITGRKMHIDCGELYEQINGLPFLYFVSKSASGSALTSFVWFSNTYEFKFYLEKAILKTDPWYQMIENQLIKVLD